MIRKPKTYTCACVEAGRTISCGSCLRRIAAMGLSVKPLRDKVDVNLEAAGAPFTVYESERGTQQPARARKGYDWAA